MDSSRLHGEQYVRLTPEAAEAIAPFLGVAADQIEELALDLSEWPEDVRAVPVRGHDGRLIAGDPVLVDASENGLSFAAPGAASGPVLVKWPCVRSARVLRREQASV
jgi:hypothetical protein